MSHRFHSVTPFLVFTCSVYLSGALLYGIDTGSFGSLQVIPSFLRTFGTYDATTKTYALSSSVKSAMNSIPFAGQALGAFLSSFVVDRFGYKMTTVILAIIQLIAVIIELTCNFTGSWGQFTAGRFLAYVSSGLAEMSVTHYNSEVSPASTRGLLAGGMLFINALGNVWGAGMSQAYATETQPKGWIIPQATQMIPAVILLMLIWFTPESPRWLVLKGRHDQALQSLNRLRPSKDVQSGITELEIEAIEQSLREQGGLGQGRWIDLFKGNMLRRTWIAWSLFVFLQFTGTQFVNSYGATFYVSEGLAAKSFTYILIGFAMQAVSALFQIFMYDYVGRRPFAIAGGLLCFIFLTIVSTLGASTNASDSTGINTVIASIILTGVFAKWSGTNAFVIGAEIGGAKMRKKVMASAGVVNMCSAILVASVTPYLMATGPGSAGLGAKVGWFFAAPSLLLFFFGVFFVPELKGRSLEEVDELYDAGLKWAWQFAPYKTKGTAARITALENQNSDELRRLSVTEGKVVEASNSEQGNADSFREEKV